MFDFESQHSVTIDQGQFAKSLEDRTLGYFLAARNRETSNCDAPMAARVAATIDGTHARLWLHGLNFPYGNDMVDGTITVAAVVGDRHILFEVSIDSDFNFSAVEGSFRPDPNFKE